MILCAGHVGEIKVWDLVNKENVKSVQTEQKGYIANLAILKGGQQFITYDQNHELKIWDMEKFEEINSV